MLNLTIVGKNYSRAFASPPPALWPRPLITINQSEDSIVNFAAIPEPADNRTQIHLDSVVPSLNEIFNAFKPAFVLIVESC